MMIFKNAIRNVTRAKGRSILIGVIIIIIAFSVCIGLCIRQAAADAQEDALEEMNITAQISPDREAAMEKVFQPGEDFDSSQLPEQMQDTLSLDELQIYAQAESVKSFYYTLSANANASGTLEPYSTDNTDNTSSIMPGGGMMGASGDFSITGYSSDDAMTQFIDGTCTIESGSVFKENTSEKVCIISDELAMYNNLEVGDSIKLSSPEDEDTTFALKIVGIYNNSQASAQAGGMGMPGRMGRIDPANEIYMSYTALAAITKAKDITANISGTYVLGDLAAYESFCEEVISLGLTDDYTVSSSDLNAYEQSAQPLENLAKFAGYFLIVILLIGAAILIVLNIFATRERKYEIGVLTAIGMKKSKVAGLFMTEILIITLAGIIIGGSIGAAVSTPVADALLESQLQSQQEKMAGRDNAFGRDFNGMQPGQPPESMTSSDENPLPEKPDNADTNAGPDMFKNYISDISVSVDIAVLLELFVICIVLSIISGIVSVTAIMRYEPLQILSNRD